MPLSQGYLRVPIKSFRVKICIVFTRTTLKKPSSVLFINIYLGEAVFMIVCCLCLCVELDPAKAELTLNKKKRKTKRL